MTSCSHVMDPVAACRNRSSVTAPSVHGLTPLLRAASAKARRSPRARDAGGEVWHAIFPCINFVVNSYNGQFEEIGLPMFPTVWDVPWMRGGGLMPTDWFDYSFRCREDS